MVTRMDSNDVTSPVDFAIVTALQVERDAIRDRLDEYQIVQESEDPYTYYLGTVSIPDKTDTYRVVVTMLLDTGNVEAAVGATRLIQRWSPAYVFMVGIAGGIAQAGVRRGDLVVARNVYYYEPGKLIPDGEQRRPDQYFSDFLLWGRANSYEATEWKNDVLVAPPTRDQGFIPKVHFGPIASGELVIADENALEKLRRESPKLLAVAMEGAGIARAVAVASRQFLEIRGISDLANRKKNDRWHDYAANAAAAFTIGFLRSEPVTPLTSRALPQNAREQMDLPLIILRAQSLRLIRPDEILSALPADLQLRDRRSISLDYTDLSSQTKITEPETAVGRLLDSDHGLLPALTQRDTSQLLFHGLVAIPLAFLAGYLVSDRQPVLLLDYHPDTETWSWPDDLDLIPELSLSGLPADRTMRHGDIVLRVSVTFEVTPEATQAIVPSPLASVDLAVPDPQRNLVRSENQVHLYGRVFRKALDEIVRLFPGTDRIHVFYSGPVALAFHFGQQVSENIHPPVTVWNFSRGYDWGIDLEAVSRGDIGVVRKT